MTPDRAGDGDVTMQGTAPARRLRLRGGTLDGLSWTADLDVGQRICCGTGPWARSHVYVVTPDIVPGPDGAAENVAVPAAF